MVCLGLSVGLSVPVCLSVCPSVCVTFTCLDNKTTSQSPDLVPGLTLDSRMIPIASEVASSKAKMRKNLVQLKTRTPFGLSVTKTCVWKALDGWMVLICIEVSQVTKSKDKLFVMETSNFVILNFFSCVKC